MRRQFRSLGIAATAGIAGTGVLGLGACGVFPGETFKDHASVSEKVSAVRLDSDSGGVTLRGKEGVAKVSVHRKVEYHGDKPKGASHRVEDGVLVLGGCGKGCEVDYTVDLPAGLPVSGETSSGSISLSEVGPVEVTTGNGGVELDGVAGAVDVRTSNGEITGRGLEGRRIEAETSNGGIELTPASPQDVRAKTSNGEITLTVPEGEYRVASESGNGDENIGVSNDPAGDHELDVSTSNGDITVQRA